MLRAEKKVGTIRRVISMPTIGERCQIEDMLGRQLLTSCVVGFEIRSDGSGFVETQNSIYVIATSTKETEKKLVMASTLVSQPRLGERCAIALEDGQMSLTSAVVGVSVRDDGYAYIETRNSIYAVACSM